MLAITLHEMGPLDSGGKRPLWTPTRRNIEMTDEIKKMIEAEGRKRTFDVAALKPAKSNEQRQAEWNASAQRDLHREQGKNLVTVIQARVAQLQAQLQPSQELVVYCDAGRDRIRVSQFEFPTWNLAVMIGVDDDGNETQRIESVQDIKLTCKIMGTSAGERRPIGFRIPVEP